MQPEVKRLVQLRMADGDNGDLDLDSGDKCNYGSDTCDDGQQDVQDACISHYIATRISDINTVSNILLSSSSF